MRISENVSGDAILKGRAVARASVYPPMNLLLPCCSKCSIKYSLLTGQIQRGFSTIGVGRNGGCHEWCNGWSHGSTGVQHRGHVVRTASRHSIFGVRAKL